ncbi:FimB/Mfa2 family fimbrial subunit, partial [Prevotella brevis]
MTEPVSVKVSFSGFDFSVVPDQNFATSRASAAEAQVTCIAFKVFDENNKEFYAERKTKGENENFDQINCELPAGKYTFVAVAHKAKTPSNGAADIVSPDKAVINDIMLYKSTYATTMYVDITRGEPKDVTMDFGKRITASFWLYITDPYPEEVDEVEIIIDPNQNVDTPNQYAFNPFTGFSFAKQTYTTNFYKNNSPTNSFSSGPMISCLLTAEEQVVDIKVNMKDSSGKLIRTRTFNAVTLK